MAEVSKVNAVAIADIETINGVDADDIETLDGVDFITGFSNNYSFAVGNVVAGGGTYQQSSYMSSSNTGNYHFRSGGSDSAFSVSVWFKFPNVGGGSLGAASQKLISKGINSAREWDLQFYGSNATVMWRLNSDNSNRIYMFDGNWSHLTSSWHHIAATYDGSEAKEGLNYYIDGAIQNQDIREDGSYSGLNDSGKAVLVAAQLGVSNPQSIGYFDEVSIWSKELSAANVSHIYNSGTPTDISASGSLVTWWRMGDSDGGTGTTVTDAAPSPGGNATLTGSAAYGFLPGDGFVTVVP